MIELNHIKTEDLLKISGLESIFPFSMIYLNELEFRMPKYEWFYITDSGFNTPEERATWIGLICVTEDKYIYGENLHLSVLEVAKPLRGLTIGTKIVNKLIDVSRENLYTTLSLCVKNDKDDRDDLIRFYKRFGFQEQNVQGQEVFVLDV